MRRIYPSRFSLLKYTLSKETFEMLVKHKLNRLQDMRSSELSPPPLSIQAALSAQARRGEIDIAEVYARTKEDRDNALDEEIELLKTMLQFHAALDAVELGLDDLHALRTEPQEIGWVGAMRGVV